MYYRYVRYNIFHSYLYLNCKSNTHNKGSLCYIVFRSWCWCLTLTGFYRYIQYKHINIAWSWTTTVGYFGIQLHVYLDTISRDNSSMYYDGESVQVTLGDDSIWTKCCRIYVYDVVKSILYFIVTGINVIYF